MKRVAIAIVTFNNCTMLVELLHRLERQTRTPDSIFVIDNASSDATEKTIPQEFPTVLYKRIPVNSGSSGGYYEGVRCAAENHDYVWTLDDDVAPEDTALENLIVALEELEKVHTNIGAVRSLACPTDTIKIPTELEVAPWRGTLFLKTAIDVIGLPRQDYFLYGEDLEYSLRLRKHGFNIFWIPTSLCCEIRQGKTNDTFLGKKVRIYPTAFRLYYAFRNEISICIQYRNMKRLIKTLLYLLKVSVFISITEKTKGGHKMTAIARAILHGCTNKLGKNPEYLPA